MPLRGISLSLTDINCLLVANQHIQHNVKLVSSQPKIVIITSKHCALKRKNLLSIRFGFGKNACAAFRNAGVGRRWIRRLWISYGSRSFQANIFCIRNTLKELADSSSVACIWAHDTPESSRWCSSRCVCVLLSDTHHSPFIFKPRHCAPIMLRCFVPMPSKCGTKNDELAIFWSRLY